MRLCQGKARCFLPETLSCLFGKPEKIFPFHKRTSLGHVYQSCWKVLVSTSGPGSQSRCCPWRGPANLPLSRQAPTKSPSALVPALAPSVPRAPCSPALGLPGRGRTLQHECDSRGTPRNWMHGVCLTDGQPETSSSCELERHRKAWRASQYQDPSRAAQGPPSLPSRPKVLRLAFKDSFGM